MKINYKDKPTIDYQDKTISIKHNKSREIYHIYSLYTCERIKELDYSPTFINTIKKRMKFKQNKNEVISHVESFYVPGFNHLFQYHHLVTNQRTLTTKNKIVYGVIHNHI